MELPKASNNEPDNKPGIKSSIKSIIDLDPEAILGVDGPIAKQLDYYEPRPPQILMATSVKDNLKNRRHLFCEAGTGTGKSYAFLIPAIEKALNGGGPVVISTNTISLQEQIFNKDVPDLKKYLGLPNLRVVLQKGRNNYISLRRLRNAHNYEWTPEQITEFEDVQTWADSTKTGSKQDMNDIVSGEIWEQVGSDRLDCMGKKCPTYKKCHYFRSKEEAAKAHIIICNHALLTLDLAIKHKTDGAASILPNYKHLIIDEAHALEEAIRRSGTFEWRKGSAASLVKRATNRKKKGLLDGLLDYAGDMPHHVITQTKEAIKQLTQFAEVNVLFFDRDVEPFIKQGLRNRQQPSAKRIKPGNLGSARFQSLLSTIHTANMHLNSAVNGLRRAAEGEFADKSLTGKLTLLENFSNRTKEVESDLVLAVKAENAPGKTYSTHVSFVEPYKYRNTTGFMIVSTPIFVREMAQKILFNQIPSITLTSATLTTNNSFNGITRNLGSIAAKTDVIQLPHVFDYKKQVKIILTPKIGEDPWNNPIGRNAYFDKVAKGVKKYVDKTQGNALILCTSNLQMKALYDRLADDFTKQGFYPLRQGGGMTRDQLAQEIKTVPNTVLFGVDSFWTGVDIPGSHLSNVIIPKLPFPPPTPLSDAQKEIYDMWNRGKPRNKQRNFFGDRVVPAVAIKLQQGFGRLIRRTTDVGIVVLMDPRLVTKGYGRTLLGSLPSCDVLRDNDVC
jgi:ATP-dependent DNA helicase DinG